MGVAPGTNTVERVKRHGSTPPTFEEKASAVYKKFRAQIGAAAHVAPRVALQVALQVGPQVTPHVGTKSAPSRDQVGTSRNCPWLFRNLAPRLLCWRCRRGRVGGPHQVPRGTALPSSDAWFAKGSLLCAKGSRLCAKGSRRPSHPCRPAVRRATASSAPKVTRTSVRAQSGRPRLHE